MAGSFPAVCVDTDISWPWCKLGDFSRTADAGLRRGVLGRVRPSESLPVCTYISLGCVSFVLGTVVGVVLYTGRELRSVMNTSNPRSKVCTRLWDVFSCQNFLTDVVR